jgi:hypothetical protein
MYRKIYEQEIVSRISPIKPGTPCSKSFYIHKIASSIPEVLSQEFIYFRRSNKIVHIAWVIGWQVRYLQWQIYTGNIYLVRKSKSGRRPICQGK